MEEEEHLRRMRSHRQRLDKKMKDLEIRCESLEQSEMFMKSQNEAERRVREEERRKVHLSIPGDLNLCHILCIFLKVQGCRPCFGLITMLVITS